MLGRMDLVHILGFQTLKFWKRLRQSNNTTLHNTFMCFHKVRDYLVLLRTYSCTTTDSIDVLKCKVHEHYSYMLDYWLIDDILLLCVCVCASACICVLLVGSFCVFLPTRWINVFNNLPWQQHTVADSWSFLSSSSFFLSRSDAFSGHG